MTLGQRLRELRLERGLRQSQVGSSSAISQLENGRFSPSLRTVIAFAAFYGMTLQALLEPVEGYRSTPQNSFHAALPRALRELIEDPIHGQGLTPDWIVTLSRIEYMGRRPRTKMDYFDAWRVLRTYL